MFTFKQFLLEGGKATAKLGTVRATMADVDEALELVSKITGIPLRQLAKNLVGSSRLTYLGHQAHSGDIDLALDENKVNREDLLKKMTAAVGHPPKEIIAGVTYSYAVPVKDHKVQLDLMFVPDLNWTRFSHHASEHSKHKSGVRNELLHAVLKHSPEPNKDLRVTDEHDVDLARASRSYKLDQGVERIFKITPKRKDGKGYVKTSVKATPEQVQATLDELGHKGKFSREIDLIRDPDQFARLLFGDKTRAKDMMSTEQLIELIKNRKDADVIFKDAVKGIKARGFDVPSELKRYAR